jgi:hypothetical protein
MRATAIGLTTILVLAAGSLGHDDAGEFAAEGICAGRLIGTSRVGDIRIK